MGLVVFFRLVYVDLFGFMCINLYNVWKIVNIIVGSYNSFGWG